MNFSTSSRYVLMSTIVCILLVISTACTDIVPLPTKAPTRTPTSVPPPTSTPVGGLVFETIKEPRNCDSRMWDSDFDYDIDQTDARKKVVVLDEAKHDKVAVIVADKDVEMTDIDLLVGEMNFSREQTVSDVLQKIDLSQYFVVGAFRSFKVDTGCHNVVIPHITQQHETLTIYLEVHNVGDGEGACGESVSAPCHIVKVERPESLVIEEDTVQVIPVAVTTTPRPPRE